MTDRRRRRRPTPVLAVDGVTKSFRSGPPWHRRRVEVLRGASLEVRAGRARRPGRRERLRQEHADADHRRPARPRRRDVSAPGAARLLPAAAAAVGQADGRRALRAVRARPTSSTTRGGRARATGCSTSSASPGTVDYRVEDALGRHAPEAQPRARAAARPAAAAARRALRGLRLGDLPALLGDGRAPPRGRAWASSSSATCSPSASA